MRKLTLLVALACLCQVVLLPACLPLYAADDFPKPYSPPCLERENVFEFTEKPAVKTVGEDRYEITFAVKSNCDVTVGIMDPAQDPTGGGCGVVLRHLASGVLGANAPAPFQKNSLKQTIYWDGKDDLGVYHKTPEKLQVRVMLGLKPVFDRRLGGTSPKNLPGYVPGIALAQDGAYVIVKANSEFGHSTIRKFDREGNYIQTLSPPPASLPEGKLAGMSYVEYESGKRALHGPGLEDSVSVGACYLPPLDGDCVSSCQPVVVGNRLVFATGGKTGPFNDSFLHYIYTDGSTDLAGLKGRVLVKGATHKHARLAASPDGKTLYLSNVREQFGGGVDSGPSPVFFSRPLDGEKAAEVFAGEPGKVGSDNAHLSDAQGIDCDPEGRVYVADSVTNRIQVFSPDRKYLKTIAVDRPNLIRIHKKTGAIYVLHTARVEGRSVSRVTKLVSFADPKEEFHVDGLEGMMALDSWSAKARLWFGSIVKNSREISANWGVRIFEEDAGKLRLIGDFAAEAEKEPGRLGWGGVGSLSGSKSVCDPVREKFYYGPGGRVFNLVTGTYEGSIRFPGPADDIAFDKKGYLHGHENPGRGNANVWRADPGRASPFKDWQGVHKDIIAYPECPYDYGEEAVGLKGVVRTKCQPGACTFQMGLGVNMQGDLAVESQIYYVPKMEDEGMELAMTGPNARSATGRWVEEGFDLNKLLKETEMRGEQLYAIRREPGIPLCGSTIFTWDRLGEAKSQYPVVIGQKLEGVQIDEEGAVYFATRHARRVEGKPFLQGKAGRFGEERRSSPPVWVCGKGRPEKLKVLLNKAIVPLDQKPDRPFELGDPDAWVEGADWLYAGYGPSVAGGCVCPQSRFHLDWYKRSYMPESYRHGFAVLDTNGNLILHVGRYANFDSAPGGKDGCKPGEKDIGILNSRYLGGTDNYLAFEDWGERLVVLKLNYEAEETVPLRTK